MRLLARDHSLTFLNLAVGLSNDYGLSTVGVDGRNDDVCGIGKREYRYRTAFLQTATVQYVCQIQAYIFILS